MSISILLRTGMLFLFSFSSLLACCCHSDGRPYGCLPYNLYDCRYRHLSLAPEFSYVRRVREGGTKQTGGIYGFRASYDRIKPWGFYWGIDGYGAQGTLKGRSGMGDRLKSTFCDTEAEARLGYTCAFNIWGSPLFTPFIGGGYKQEVNKFRSPSPLTLKYKISYGYVVGGLLSSLNLTPCLQLGLNFKIWMPWQVKCKVSDDPDFESQTLKAEDKLGYRLEAPLLFRCCWTWLDSVGISPFYEFRHYGRRENFPHDFFDTKLHMYGLNIQFVWAF